MPVLPGAAYDAGQVASGPSKRAPHERAPEKGAPRRAFVVVLAGDRMGEMFELDPVYTTIGRGLTATVRVNDEGISRTHAAVSVENAVYYLSDAGSTNGTFANGERVDRHPLREGDKIQLGAASVLRFTFHEDSDDDYQRDLYESTLRDRLTGLFSRGYFTNRLEGDVAVALRHGKPLALVRFEVDRLDRVRESVGASHADLILRDMARTIQEITRSDDLLARFGDEDFAFLCRDVDAMRAARAARRIREAIAAHAFNLPSRPDLGPEFTTRLAPDADAPAPLRLTLSLGVADLALLHEPAADALLKAAESALVIARRAGGDRVEIYDPENEPTRLV